MEKRVQKTYVTVHSYPQVNSNGIFISYIKSCYIKIGFVNGIIQLSCYNGFKVVYIGYNTVC